MVKQVKGGYKVYSESGKPLSRVYPTKSQAQAWLKQIHYFQNKNK